MTVNTTIRTRVLASMNLSKVIFPEIFDTPFVKNNVVYKNYKVIYKATVSGNDEYKDIVGVGRTEMDAFKKLNDSLFSAFKVRHFDKYKEIENDVIKIKPTTTSKKEVGKESNYNTEENVENAEVSEDSTSAENAA